MRTTIHKLQQVFFAWVLVSQAFAQSSPYRIKTIAGPGDNGDYRPARLAVFRKPIDVATDPQGNIYIADSEEHRVRKIAKDGIITTVAGTGIAGFSGDNGLATLARLDTPTIVRVDPQGRILILDSGNRCVRVVGKDGVIRTMGGVSLEGGSSTLNSLGEVLFLKADKSVLVRTDSQGKVSQFPLAESARSLNPTILYSDAAGDLYIADSHFVPPLSFTNRIIRIRGGNLEVIAGGNGTRSSGDGGPAVEAGLGFVSALSVDSAGNLLIGDSSAVRRVDPGGVIRTIASVLVGALGQDLDGSYLFTSLSPPSVGRFSPNSFPVQVAGDVPVYETGPAATAYLRNPAKLTNGPDGSILLGDSGALVRKVGPDGGITSLTDLLPNDYSLPFSPAAMAVDRMGRVFYSMGYGLGAGIGSGSGGGFSEIIRVDGGGRETSYGGGGTFACVEGDIPLAQYRSGTIRAMAFDSGGSLYVASANVGLSFDSQRAEVVKITPNGAVSHFAGAKDCKLGDPPNGGPASSSPINFPTALAVDLLDNVYIAVEAGLFSGRVFRVDRTGRITAVRDTGGLVSGFAFDKAGVPFVSTLYRDLRAGGSVYNLTTGGFIPGVGDRVGSAGLTTDRAGNLIVSDLFSKRVLQLELRAATDCVASVSPSGLENIAPAGGKFRIQVTAATNCNYTGLSDSSWVTVAPVPSTKEMDVTVTANNAALYRAATLTVGGVAIAVRQFTAQAAAPPLPSCSYAVSPLSLNVPSSGGTRGANIQTDAGCSWSVSGLASWITVSGATSGSGPASVFFVVAANAGTARTATVSVAGFSITVAQQAGTPSGTVVVTEILNNYGLINSGTVAQGALFIIKGSDLSDQTTTLQNVPLQTTLRGVQIRIVIGGTTTFAPLYYVLPQQLAGILPSNTPTGTGTLTVINNGRTSSNAAITVVRSAFGALTLNGAGVGGAAVHDSTYTLLSNSNSTNPGKAVVFYGSGVGPTTGDETVDQLGVNASGDLTSIPISVEIGGKAAEVLYRGRTQFPGLDQINVVIPTMDANGYSCTVPVVIRTNNVLANSVTIPIASSGNSCITQSVSQ